MVRKAFWSLVTIMLACTSTMASEVRRVVTGLDDSGKAVVLFDSGLALKPGKSGLPAMNLWMTDSTPAGLSFKDVVGDHAPARGLPVRHPMMHRTRTVDYAIIMSGEIDMMLDNTVVHVKAGDVAIQQATNHAWVNHSGRPCRVMFVLMDSKQP